jgi:hypothetical protein
MDSKTTSRVLTLAEAATLIGQKFGIKPSVQTIWRWAKKGVDGQMLESVRIGRRIRTTDEAVEQFLKRLSPPSGAAATSDSRSEPSPAAFSKPQRAATSAAAAKEVEDAKRRLGRYRRHRSRDGQGGAA